MKILIVGAGIGGSTLAAFLKDSEIECDIIEKSNDWSKHGYSIGLWENGRRILGKLGLSEMLDKAGSQIHYYCIRDGQGKLLKKFDLREFYVRYGDAYTHINRDLLHEMLRARSGSKIKMGTSIANLEQKKDKVIATFDDGDKKEYDLVIGADGIHSKVRLLAFDAKSVEHYDDKRIWYTWVDKKYTDHATVTDYIQAGEFINTFDCGDKALLVMVSPADHTTWDDQNSRISHLKKALAHESIISSGVLDALNAKDISPTDLEHIHLKNWVQENVVLLGDAAHGFEPHAGLGGSMAMEDGYVLAAQLMKVSSTYPMSEALKTYERTRKIRVNLARKLTNRMRCWTLIKSKILRRIINGAIPYIPESFFTYDYHKLMREEI